MEGIEYYSASRKRMRTLFAQSYVIDGPDKQERVPDPKVEEIPAYSRLYIFQKDLTFGGNVYRSEYRYSGQYFLLTNLNTTTMRYFLLPMVKPEQSVTYILLIPAGKEILFYGVAGAHTMSFFGLESDLRLVYKTCRRLILKFQLTTTLLRPRCFAWYMAPSARLIHLSGDSLGLN